MVTWDTIECIEGNGIITGYTVVFQEQGEANVPGNIVDKTFYAGGLTPFTSYTFQVAGVNDVGTGPLIPIITITTDEEGLFFNQETLTPLIFTHCTNAVPGPVSDLTALPKSTSIDLTWNAPQEPNGVIISYEVTYRVTENNLVTTNTTDLSTTFSISPLTPQTTVSNISVSAYTSIGPGEAATIADRTTLEEQCEPTIDNICCCSNCFRCLAPVMNIVVGGVLVGIIVAVVIVVVVVVFIMCYIKR